jgi:hypothetical protein
LKCYEVNLYETRHNDKGVFMKYVLALTLTLFVWSNAQTPAQKIDRAFDLLDQALYWQTTSFTVSDGFTVFIDTAYIAPDSYRTNIWSDNPDGADVNGIHIGDTGWVSVDGDPWQEGYAEPTIIDFGEDSFEGAKIEFLGQKPFTPPCDNYKIEGGLEICIDVVSGLPRELRFSDGTGTMDLLYVDGKPAPITPPITVEIE